MNKGVIWDLCSGLGGWTEAFVQDGWTVIRIENNPLLQHIPHTYPLDVLDWRQWIENFPTPDIIVASPPCLEFSNAYAAPKPTAHRAGKEFHPDMRVLQAVVEIIQTKDPTWWIIENVGGANHDFSKWLGQEPNQILMPFLLWGKFPAIPMPKNFQHEKQKNDKRNSKIRSNYLAMIPFELSFSLLQTWREQRTLLEWV